jgi:2-hydroxy-3-keto-5-methylthiopentenyl-1-phosphate phosphatase
VNLAVFVDYDGTITDRDTFDVLVHVCAGREQWLRLEAGLTAGSISLREALAAQAAFVRLSLEEAESEIARHARIEPSFAPFARACLKRGVELTIVSGGIATLIERALSREGLSHLRVLANDADVTADGWRMTFRDETAHGHDKAPAVRDARARGLKTVYVGDGISDFDAALAADTRFAKRGLALERFLTQERVAFTPFSNFDEIARALFGPAAGSKA